MLAPRHIAPQGISKAFDRWLCGAPAYVGDDFADKPAEATCRTCLAAWQLQCEARGWQSTTGDGDE